MTQDEEGLSEYERLRLERIRKNEAYLASLGLSKPLQPAKRKAKTGGSDGRPKKKATTLPPPVERRSKRIKKNQQPQKQEDDADDLVMLSYRETDDRTLRAVKQAQPDETVAEVVNSRDNNNDDEDDHSHRPTRRSRPIAINILTEDEKQVLSQMDQNYLDKFREFLVYHDKISAQNERNVMRQVTKLAHGEGIRYESPKYGWPEGCYFLKGIKVTPLSDLVELLQQAVEAENQWGQDRGNGWLLRHPLKKLLLFQQFCLQHPDFLMAQCKLQEYIS